MGKKGGKKGGRKAASAASDSGRSGKNGSYYAALEDNANGPAQNTRGKKKGRRNVNSNVVYDQRLRESIEADGTKAVIEMAADGNCLFRSLSDQLYHDYGNKHEEVRRDVCKKMEAHEDEFSVFLVLDDDEVEEDARDFDDYVEKMRTSGEWGGNLELVVAARLYRRNITVYSASLAAFTIDHGHPNQKPAGPDLLLSFHDNDHYNSVRDSTRGKPPVPIKTFAADLPSTTGPGESKEEEQPHDEKSKKGSNKVTPAASRETGGIKSNRAGPALSKKAARKQKRLAGRQQRNNQMEVQHADESPNEPEMTGDFRVLKI